MRKLGTIVLALALWTFPAAAGQRHERDSGRHGGYEHGDHRDARVAELAHELAWIAHRVHERAEKTAHRRRWREAPALRALHRLDAEARHFRRHVLRGHEPAARDLHRLLHAYRSAEARLHSLRARKRIERDFERAGRLLDRLEHVYANRSRGRRDRYARADAGSRPWFRVQLAWH